MVYLFEARNYFSGFGARGTFASVRILSRSG
jgi:hypothetical protein